MGLVDELQKLSELHRTGALNDMEYARAKAMLLADPQASAGSASADAECRNAFQAEDPIFARSLSPEDGEFPVTVPVPDAAPAPAPDPVRRRQVSARLVEENFSERMSELHAEQELARIDREWEQEREQYLVRGRYGASHVPGAGDVAGPAFGAVFGVFWCMLAFSITSGAPNEGPFTIIKIMFPLFGVVVTLLSVVQAFTNWTRLNDYDRASAAWQERRESVRR